jgi:hypothetical protein
MLIKGKRLNLATVIKNNVKITALTIVFDIQKVRTKIVKPLDVRDLLV